MPKNGFPMPNEKNNFRFLIYTLKSMYLKKHGLEEKNYKISHQITR